MLDNALLKEMLVRSSFQRKRRQSASSQGHLIPVPRKTSHFCRHRWKRLARLFADIEFGEGQSGSCVFPLRPSKKLSHFSKLKTKNQNSLFYPIKSALKPITSFSSLNFSTANIPMSTASFLKIGSPYALHREELISLLRQVSLFTKDQSSAVRFTLNAGELHLAAMGGDIGEGKVSMVANYGGLMSRWPLTPISFLTSCATVKMKSSAELYRWV